jgi:hypothetical protein
MKNQIHQIPENYQIFLLKSDFHKINKMIDAKEKTFKISICSKTFFFSKEQIILFSVKSFLFISKTQQSFNIPVPSTISEDYLVSCFEKIFSLFSNLLEIEISQTNVLAFQFLSEVFENSSLFSICQVFYHLAIHNHSFYHLKTLLKSQKKFLVH